MHKPLVICVLLIYGWLLRYCAGQASECDLTNSLIQNYRTAPPSGCSYNFDENSYCANDPDCQNNPCSCYWSPTLNSNFEAYTICQCQCAFGYLGAQCQTYCPACNAIGTASIESNCNCVCQSGYGGPTCSQKCLCNELFTLSNDVNCNCACDYTKVTPINDPYCNVTWCGYPNNNCFGHGTCTYLSANSIYECVCQSGWIGTYCNIPNCASNQNQTQVCGGPGRGSCNSTTSTCSCLPGYGGEFCQFQCASPTVCGLTAKACTQDACDFPVCECSGHGHLVTALSSPAYQTCSCDLDYGGPNCEYEFNSVECNQNSQSQPSAALIYPQRLSTCLGGILDCIDSRLTYDAGISDCDVPLGGLLFYLPGFINRCNSQSFPLVVPVNGNWTNNALYAGQIYCNPAPIFLNCTAGVSTTVTGGFCVLLPGMFWQTFDSINYIVQCIAGTVINNGQCRTALYQVPSALFPCVATAFPVFIANRTNFPFNSMTANKTYCLPQSTLPLCNPNSTYNLNHLPFCTIMTNVIFISSNSVNWTLACSQGLSLHGYQCGFLSGQCIPSNAAQICLSGTLYTYSSITGQPNNTFYGGSTCCVVTIPYTCVLGQSGYYTLPVCIITATQAWNQTGALYKVGCPSPLLLSNGSQGLVTDTLVCVQTVGTVVSGYFPSPPCQFGVMKFCGSDGTNCPRICGSSSCETSVGSTNTFPLDYTNQEVLTGTTVFDSYIGTYVCWHQYLQPCYTGYTTTTFPQCDSPNACTWTSLGGGTYECSTCTVSQGESCGCPSGTITSGLQCLCSNPQQYALISYNSAIYPNCECPFNQVLSGNNCVCTLGGVLGVFIGCSGCPAANYDCVCPGTNTNPPTNGC